ncbi:MULTISPECIES: OsmC family protein [unclassified Thioalkalivibrio]|uniref:OsmC family protein n=1 Tax=unclassified Thioalkalivibrio TaxID=2621013 RepID=UPI000374126E|nr:MULTISPECIES: OsmC family protein [unclassified Thioalkalivibrio]
MSQSTVKAALMETMAGLQRDGSAAKVVFRADTHLEEDMRCSAKVREFEPIFVDEPPELGGADTAANPVELVLVALGACQEIMYRAYASVMDIPLNGVEVKLRGHLDLRGLFAIDESVPAGYQKVFFETHIDSPADAATLGKLIEMVESHCPVLDTLVRSVEVEGKVKVNGKSLELEAATAG